MTKNMRNKLENLVKENLHSRVLIELKQALNKATAEPPTKLIDCWGYFYYVCPKCKNTITKPIIYSQYYCMYCGQKITETEK